MNPQNLPIKLKSTKEILSSIRDLTHRHWKRWIRKRAKHVGDCSRQEKCATCVGIPDAECVVPESFVLSPADMEKMKQEFREDINNPAKLIRDYRDVAMLLWVLGLLDERDNSIPVEDRIVDEALKMGEPARELRIALNFPVDSNGFINIGDGNRIEATAFFDAMKRFQDKPPEKVTFVHERRVSAAPPRSVVVGNSEAGPKNRRAVPEAGTERPK